MLMFYQGLVYLYANNIDPKDTMSIFNYFVVVTKTSTA